MAYLTMWFPIGIPADKELRFCDLVLLMFYVTFGKCIHGGITGKEIRVWQPKYPPVIWYPEYPMFHNRTSAARIVVQMHDSLDFFCPDYLNSQYQSFAGAKKRPADYGAEEIYMVNGEDYQACLQDDPKERRLNKKHTKLLLRCPNKITANDHHTIRPNNNIKAKYQYTVSFRMFSPMPKGPEFSCSHEYYFLGIFTKPRSQNHKATDERRETLMCSPSTLRLQIFVSCNDGPAAKPSTDNASALGKSSKILTATPAPPGEGPKETTTKPLPLWSLSQSLSQLNSDTFAKTSFPPEIPRIRLSNLSSPRTVNISRSDTRISQLNIPANQLERSLHGSLLDKTGISLSRHKHVRPTYAATQKPSQFATIDRTQIIPLVEPTEIELHMEIHQETFSATSKQPAPVPSVPPITSKPKKHPPDMRRSQKDASISPSVHLCCSRTVLLITVFLVTCWF